MQKNYKILFFTLTIVCTFFLQNTFAQCNYQKIAPPTLPDNCGTAFDVNTVVNTCKTVCIDMTTATASSTIPSCGSGSVTNDVWLKSQDPYTNIPGFDGSYVFAWKKFPGYPNHANVPTTATHGELNGSITPNFPPFPIGMSINCSDGFGISNSGLNLNCSDVTAADYDNQGVLKAGTIPTNAQIRQLLIDDPNISNATVNNSMSWTQIETYNNVPGEICFEVSTYKAGFSCQDPKNVTFTNVGNTQTQTFSECLCNTAQNGGFFNFDNTPCTDNTANPFLSTTAFYKLNLAYSCNQIEAKITNWAGTGSLNVAILSDLTCPDVTITDQNGNTSTAAGLKVGSATTKAQGCLTTGNTISTNSTDCLPAGVYYLLVSGNEDKDNFTVDVTVKNLGAPVQAKAYLQGAYNAGVMDTLLYKNNLLPNAQPYNTAPWNYAGTENLTTATNLPTDIVDWVLIDAYNNALTTLVERRAALLRKNGTIIDLNGNSKVMFKNLLANTNYYLAVRHRNHLAVLSQNPITVPMTTTYDFTNTAQVRQGATQLTSLNVNGTLFGLYAGDLNANGVIDYDDFNIWQPEETQTGYRAADCMLNGSVAIPDFDTYLNNASKIGIPLLRY